MSELNEELLSAVFASDLAQDVRGEFNQRRGEGLGVSEATGAVVGAFRHLLERADDGPVVIVALAVLQWREGQLHASLRDAAVELLQDGYGFGRQAGEQPDRRRDRERLRTELCDALAAAPVIGEQDDAAA
jgi:hypothetical protein